MTDNQNSGILLSETETAAVLKIVRDALEQTEAGYSPEAYQSLLFVQYLIEQKQQNANNDCESITESNQS